MELSMEAESRAGSVRIREVIAGQDATFVRLDDGRAGTAMHFFLPDAHQQRYLGIQEAPDPDPGAPRPPWPAGAVALLSEPLARQWEGRAVSDLLTHPDAKEPLQRSLWLSAVNALLNTVGAGEPSLDLVTLCRILPTDTVGVVGYFRPVLETLRAACATLHVFDLREIPGCLPAAMEPVLLPACDVVIITGTTLLNDTLADLLPSCSGARATALVGPSVPLSPALLETTSLNALAGSVVLSPDPVAHGLRSGQHARAVKPHLAKRQLRALQG